MTGTTTEEDAQHLRRSEIERLEAELADAQRKYTSCQELCSEQFKAFQEQLIKKEEQVMQLERQVTASSSRSTPVGDTALRELTTRNTQLEAQLAALQEQSVRHEEKITKLRDENEQMWLSTDSDVIGNEHANTTFGAAVDDAIIDDYQNRIRLLTEDFEASRHEILELQAAEVTKDSTIAAQERTLAERAQNIASYHTTLSALRKSDSDKDTTIETLRQELVDHAERTHQDELEELREIRVAKEALQMELTELRQRSVASNLDIAAERQKLESRTMELSSMTSHNRRLQDAIAYLSSPESLRRHKSFCYPDDLETQTTLPSQEDSKRLTWGQSDYDYVASQTTDAKFAHVYIRVLEPSRQGAHVRSILLKVEYPKTNMKGLIEWLQKRQGDGYDMWIVLPGTYGGGGRVSCTQRKINATPEDVTGLSNACQQDGAKIFFARQDFFHQFFKGYEKAYLASKQGKRTQDHLREVEDKVSMKRADQSRKITDLRKNYERELGRKGEDEVL
jgi:hypothetical protein